ncbi:hypothetical protein Bbelb_338730 [Branchiostoma belcheri]|nr:hypothetical protein Bbelb_338730 [Branchiostoma belcheri]
MAALSDFKNKLKPRKWDIMGKRTLLTLDLSREYHSSLRSLTELPKEVFELKELEALDLTNNKNIDLSNELIKLPNLKVLCLNAGFFDTVPATVMTLPQLEMLILSNNENITLPDEMSGLTHLTALVLDSCNLDTLPPVVLRLPNLQVLDISENMQLSLPDEFNRLNNLKVLRLRDCNLRAVPPTVLKLHQLEELDLSGNRGIHLPDGLAGLTNIRVLKLRGTDIVIVPPVVFTLTQLEWLDLSANQLQTLPAEIGQLINVKHLNLFNCKLRTLPPEVWRLTQLEWLNLSGNQLLTLPPEVGRLTQLEWLDLSFNQLQTLPAEIGQLTNVKGLNLSECELRTLPPEVGRLTQLEELYLSGNQLQTLPAEIGKLTNVKRLGLSECELRTLPPEVGRLTQLEWLYLSKNRELQTLPAEIGQLTNAKQLNLSECKLRTLPPEVWRLTQLERLSLSGNQLQTLPAEIGQLTNAKHLDLSNCKLRTLPPEVGRLTQLEELNLIRNQLQTLPAEIGQLSSLHHLDVRGNPLIKPPAEVCRRGIAAIRQYFDELERSKEAISAHLKVVILGETMAGKTSLVQTLESGKSTLTEEEDRTHCVEITQWATDDNITFEVYDFGGHDVYHLTHQFFLTPDAFYLLLVNLQTYSCSEERYTEAVGFWLDTLNARVPGAVISIVGSKKDLCRLGEVKTKTKDVQARISLQRERWEKEQRQIQSRLKSIEDIGQQHLRTLKPGLRIVGDALELCVSVKPKSRFNLSRSPRSWERFQDFLLETANDKKLFPTLTRILPKTWLDFEQLVRRQASTETGFSVVTSPRKDHVTQDVEMSTRHWLTMTDCARLGQLVGLSLERLQSALSYLQQVGTILRYTDIPELKDYVFHDPPALIELFKNLFHHDTSALFSTPRLSHFTYTQLSTFQSDLCDCGLIQKDVMACLLPPNVSPDIVTALMQHFGLSFEVQAGDNTDPSKHTHQYKIPWYLQKQMPEELKSVWPDDVPEDQEQLQLMCNITGFCPRGLFQRFSVGIHPLVKDRVDWKDGVMAYRQDYPVLVCSKPVADDTYITMATRGRLAQADEMWGVVHPLLEVLVQLLQEWPGVLYSLHVTCAHCIKAGLDRPYQHKLRDRTAEDGRDVRCPRIKKTASTSADLVYRPSRLPQFQQVERPKDYAESGNPPEKWKGAAGTSAGPRLPIILLINDEYGTSKGGVSTIHCQASKTLQGKAVVYATALRVPKQDQEAADIDKVTLITPYQSEGDTRAPPIDWLTFDFKSHYPKSTLPLHEYLESRDLKSTLPPHVDVIVGHADITDTAARNIHDEYYKDEADLIMFTHVIPEDTEYYKGGRKAMKAREKEKDMLDEVDNAKAAFSIGKRIYDHCSTKYKGEKKPQNHHIFLPKPSEIFLDANVSPGGEEKVVLSIGRVRKVEKLKGHDLAGQSLREVIKIIKNARWCVRGISEDDFETSQKILEDALNSPDLNPTLLPYGTQEDIRDDMTMAHLVLMPSRSEPFGLVGLEAIAAGIPVLISDKTGLAEMITDLIDQGKLSAEHRNVIVETSVNDRDRAGDAKRWADRIVDILQHSDSEFEKAARFKRELVESRYWEESHNAFLQACGITAAAADQ